MTKFAVRAKAPKVEQTTLPLVVPKGVIKTRSKSEPDTVTFEGADAYSRKPKSELFLLAVTNMVGENSFYEKAEDRDARFEELVHKVTAKDPDWVARFVPYLRNTLNMRTASLVMAAEYVKAGGPNGRKVIDSAIQRADEPSVMLAYWLSRHGRKIPQPVKRGVADAAIRLYSERSFIKWDSDNLSPRFGDVIELVHPKGQTAWQHDLFKYSMAKRHNREDMTRDTESLGVIKRFRDLMAVPVAERRVLIDKASESGDFSVFEGAGLTWESISGWLQGPMDAKAWEVIIPQMGYMACLAEGTPIWLSDGTALPIEKVVSNRLAVLSYDRQWDTRPVKYGPSQTPQDMAVGTLRPTLPTDWIDNGLKAVWRVSLASGRYVDATADHRWVRRRKTGRQSWEWSTTDALKVGDRIPQSLEAGFFGEDGSSEDGYFIGALLGDGGLTQTAPALYGTPGDGVLEAVGAYAVGVGVNPTVSPIGSIARMRFPAHPRKRPNTVNEIVRSHDLWGKGALTKVLPNRPYSADFWKGVLSGLVDTDGWVRLRVNAKGISFGEIGVGSISEALVRQVSDTLLRLGVPNRVVRRRMQKSIPGARIVSRHPLWEVSVSSVAALRALASVLSLRHAQKARLLLALIDSLGDRPGKKAAKSKMHAYPETVVMDRVKSIDYVGYRQTYCVTVPESSLFIANGLVTGNCIRNLRNFDDAGISVETRNKVIAKLTDPAEVASSKQMPLRFYSAYKNVASAHYTSALETALDLTLANVPVFKGKTLILVDISGSMDAAVSSGHGRVTPGGVAKYPLRWELAALFGSAVAVRAEKAELFAFSDSQWRVDFRSGGSILRTIEKFRGWIHGGTQTWQSVAAKFDGHDRVIIVTDEMASYGTPPDLGAARMYILNVAGYASGMTPSGGRNYTFGGLSDQAFKAIEAIESLRDERWPWEASI